MIVNANMFDNFEQIQLLKSGFNYTANDVNDYHMADFHHPSKYYQKTTKLIEKRASNVHHQHTQSSSVVLGSSNAIRIVGDLKIVWRGNPITLV